MSQEGMPLTENEKNDIKDIITHKKTVEQKVQEVINISIKSSEGVRKRK